jgi:hypothetical protein
MLHGRSTCAGRQRCGFVRAARSHDNLCSGTRLDAARREAEVRAKARHHVGGVQARALRRGALVVEARARRCERSEVRDVDAPSRGLVPLALLQHLRARAAGSARAGSRLHAAV